MKRYSPILFIWLICLVLLTFISYETYNNGQFTETIAWVTSTIFLLNLILYHFNVTKPEKESSDILDE